MRRWLRILGIAAPVALAVVALIVLPGWAPLFPRSVQRGLTEGALVGARLFHGALVVAGVIGSPWFGRQTIRAWKEKRRGTWSERLFLLCLSCLVSLAALELGAGVVRAWTHRFPVLPLEFAADDPDAYRIVVLGGSSALGEPYRPWVSVGHIVAWKLAEAIPERRFEPEILAWLGDSLETQHQKLAEIKHRPDAVMIYSGHNEFTHRFEENRDYTLDPGASSSTIWRAFEHVGSFSPFNRLVRELISKNRLDAPPSLKDRHQLIDPPLCDPAERAEVLADFSARLEAIVSYCDQIGAQVILVIPPANEADFEPSRSVVAPGTSEADRRRLARDFQAARSAMASDPAQAEALLRATLHRHPEFAEADYRLGQLLRALDRIDEAREHFQRALNHDGLPIRCAEPFREVYHQVAQRQPNAILIDGRRELMEASASGLLGDEVIEDAHHPNLKGYVAIAAAALRELKGRAVFGEASAAIEPPDVAGCVAHFGLDAEAIAEACERTSIHYERVAGYRYDPSERLAKSRQFAEAAQRLRAGASIYEVGLPAFDLDLDNEDLRK